VREVVVLLCCALLALLALQQDGELQVAPVWFQPLERGQRTDSGGHIVRTRGSADEDMQIMQSYANGIAPLENELVYVHAARTRCWHWLCIRLTRVCCAALLSDRRRW
jgi:hypothetical protein